MRKNTTRRIYIATRVKCRKMHVKLMTNPATKNKDVETKINPPFGKKRETESSKRIYLTIGFSYEKLES